MLSKSRQCATGERTDKQTNSRIQCPETEPHKYNQLIFDNGAKAINGEKMVFSTNDAETPRQMQKKKI